MRRLLVIAGLALGGACSPEAVLSTKVDTGTTATTTQADSQPPDDTDVIEQDPVYDDTDDTDDTAPPDPTYDMDQWTGSRVYAIDKNRGTDCVSDEVAESGTRLPADLATEMEAYCPICVDFYAVTYAARSACSGDIDLSADEVRGFLVRGGKLEIWQIRGTTDPDVRIEVTDVDWDGHTAAYTYSESWNGDGTTTIQGNLSFPVVTP